MTSNKCRTPLIRLIILTMMIVVALCAQDSAVKEFKKCDDWANSLGGTKFENGGESLVITAPRWGDRVCRIDGRPLNGYSLDLASTAEDDGLRFVLQLPLDHSAYWSNQNSDPFKVGDRIQVNYKGQGKWHPGRFCDIESNGLYSITLDDTRNEKTIDLSNHDIVYQVEKKHVLRHEYGSPLNCTITDIALSTDIFAEYKALHDVLAKEHVFVVKKRDTENDCPGVKSLLCLHNGEWSEYYAAPQADGQLMLTLKPLTVHSMTDKKIVFHQAGIDTASQVNAITAKLRTNFKRRQDHALENTVVNRKDMFGSVWEAFNHALQPRESSPLQRGNTMMYDEFGTLIYGSDSPK